MRRSAAARLRGLYRRTGHGAIGAEHAAVTGLGAQQRVAACTLMKIDAGICWHGLGLLVPALRTGQLA
jgi:hypothetical protein